MGHGHEPKDLLYGISAEFDHADDLMRAANRAREAGYKVMDAYTPFPIHGLDEAIGFRDSKVAYSIFFAGLAGFLGGLALTYYTSVIDYPLNIGGRPKFSWPSFFPIMYECTILLAGITAVFGCLAFNGLPRPNHPVFNANNFERASQDRFFLCIERKDEAFDKVETKKFMDSLGAIKVDFVYADEEGW
ncbi:MAG: DUF3341 domain-containing protein [Chthonomonas sp.]|nr:DUF3341 domain-containing protein [Chthonomonas sp.]